MKRVVWLAGLLLLVSFLFPRGITLPTVPVPPTPVVPPAPVAPAEPVDEKLVELLSNADEQDKQRIVGVYTGLVTVLSRDKGQRINTTEKWAEVQANTLQMAIDTPGKYPGVDTAIEAVFAKQLGTDDVLPSTPETQAKLLAACKMIIASAQTAAPAVKK
jgi:hypothetical protein